MTISKTNILSVAAIVSLPFFSVEAALAFDLTPVVKTDTLTKLVVTWSGNGSIDGDAITFKEPSLNNWLVPSTTLEYSGGEALPHLW